MKKHFEQAIAFDHDNPLNQRVGLGKKYNELVDEYNTLEEKYNKMVKSTNETVSGSAITKSASVTPTKKSSKK